LLFSRNGLWTNSISLPVVKKLEGLWHEPWPEFKCVAFTPGCAVAALWGKNSFWVDGTVPAEALHKLEEVAARGGTLRSLAFGPKGGWVVAFDRADAAYGGLPPALARVLGEAARAQNSVRCVAFTSSGDWICLAEKDWWTSNPDLAASRAVAEQVKAGQMPKWVAFAPVDDGEGPYRLEIKPAQKIHATLTTDIGIPGAKVAEWYLYVSKVPNLPGQTNVTSTFEPGGSVVWETSALHRPLFLSRIADGSTSVHSVWTIDATLMSRRLLPLQSGEAPPAAPPLPPEQRKAFTAESPTLNYSSPKIQQWLMAGNLWRREPETPMAFAHRAYAYIKHHFTYEFPTPLHSAAQTCEAGKSDCGGLSALFVATMRANGIPARLTPGRWASSQTDAPEIDPKRFHVKSEFFAPSVGWVPVDMSSAVTDQEGSDFRWFGNEAGNFLTMAEGEDMTVDSFIAGPKNVSIFQGVNYWWRGRGDQKTASYVDIWTVKKE
jgi:hypothetical protein